MVKPYRLTLREYVIYLYFIYILLWHPDDGRWCIWNMLGNSSIWSYFIGQFTGLLHEYNRSGKFVYTTLEVIKFVHVLYTKYFMYFLMMNS